MSPITKGRTVIAAEAAIQKARIHVQVIHSNYVAYLLAGNAPSWIPVFAGMTVGRLP